MNNPTLPLPGNELDFACAEKMGLKPEWVDYHRLGILNDIVPTIEIQLPGGSTRRETCPRYSENETAAFILVDFATKIKPDIMFELYKCRGVAKWVAEFEGYKECIADTPAEAICFAFLALDLGLAGEGD